MDDDDRPGYLMDYVHSWAKKHEITSGEAIYQSDSVNEDLPEFALEVLRIAGIIDDE